MQAAQPLHDATTLRMIEAMTVSAFELGTAAVEIAKTAGDNLDRFLAFTAEFRHCFFAVRMGIRLKVFGVSAPRGPARPALEPLERERLESSDYEERLGIPRRSEPERERDRDAEPVSLPQFLKTLGIVSARAEQVRDQYPARIRETTLPTLKALLAQADPKPEPEPRRPGPALAVLARPAAAPQARTKLLNSARAAPITPSRPPPRPSG
jgi:hypothetical protein